MLQTSKSVEELSKQLLGGISPGVGLMLAGLILDPQISLNPYFWTILLGGFAVLTISLLSFAMRKWKWRGAVWQVAGTSIAGFVLVSWGIYDSFVAGTLILVATVVLIAAVGLYSRKRIRRNYGRTWRAVYAALFLCALVPLTPLLSHIGEPPVVSVSPSNKFVTFSRGGTTRDVSLTIVSVYSSAWRVRITARSPELLAVYLDGREGGPLEIPYLERGREITRFLRIEASPFIANGTYNVEIEFDYEDALNKDYVGTTSLQVIVGYQARPCLIATATFGSEVSPAVQFLRDFRDRLVLSTKAGSAFMEIFNAWYYSFSPFAARHIVENARLRTAVRVVLYPLLGVLGVSALAYSIFSVMPELAVIIAGLVASSLIGVTYLTLPALVGMRTLVKGRKMRITGVAKTALTLLTAAVALLTIGEATGSFPLLAAGGSASVLVCLFGAPTIAALVIHRNWDWPLIWHCARVPQCRHRDLNPRCVCGYAGAHTHETPAVQPLWD